MTFLNLTVPVGHETAHSLTGSSPSESLKAKVKALVPLTHEPVTDVQLRQNPLPSSLGSHS